MAKFYAQINDDSIVLGISQLKGEVDDPNMVLIDDYDTSILGSLYDPVDGTFTPQETVVDFGVVITKRAFSRRLNPVIREALRNTTDETAIDIREDLNFASHVDLSNSDLIMSLAYLVYAGFITQAESDYVLNTPVTESEV
tara:strand:+ start:322 stop:744 length:423 start_codon:yes stop_codon:yes gene_type:complete